ncbi:MAG TPA: DEAD/DEAH box helicase [Cyclobacteriaceae bacterium]|nr:DEAD/DEAH box helicase [Cyclobacteriaceae bacterium]
MLDQILKNLNFSALNPMQEETLKTCKREDGVLILSPTGSGKTVAFLLPIVASLDPDSTDIQSLIIVPSRELGLQISQVFKSMKTDYKVTVCYGGHEMRVERNNLANPPAVLIGTPGRLTDHLEKGNIDLGNVRTLVLDEFDKSLEFGFESEMKRIINQMPRVTKRILTSATHAVKVPAFIGMRDYAKLDYSGDQIPQQLTLKMVRALGNDKFEAVVQLLGKLGSEPVLVFCNHKDAVARISELLRNRDISHVTFHGNLDQDQRERALIKFRNGSVKIMITTDLASRGLDIPEVRYVVHYQLPPKEEAFIHRNGRTARMEATGTAYLLLTERDSLPRYLNTVPQEEPLEEGLIPQEPEWKTIYISGGKKEKINKVDIVGWLLQKGGLDKADLGRIEVKDFGSYVAIKSDKVDDLIPVISEERLKKKKVKVSVE